MAERYERRKREQVQVNLNGLPSDLAEQIAMNRVVGAAEAAAFCNYSVEHWRRLSRAKKVPPPVKLSTRKLGWKLGTLVAFAQREG